MSQPPAYSIATDFSAEEAAGTVGLDSVDTTKIDTEFTNIQTTIAAIRTNLALMQADDGSPVDDWVDLPALHDNIISLITSNADHQGAWASSTAYTVGQSVLQSSELYLCIEAHTSGTFSTDLAANKWVRLSYSTLESTITSHVTHATVGGQVDETDTDATKDKLISNLLAKTFQDYVDVGHQPLSTALLIANNLSDVGTPATALSNIGGIGAATADTLTNKTIDADGTGNVITNIGSSEVKSELLTGQSDTAIAAGDSIIYSDADDSGNLKKDTVQGILDLVTAGITLETEQATTSGTSFDYTGLPAGLNKITLIFKEVSQTGTDDFLVTIGDSGGLETTGYLSTTKEIDGTAVATQNSAVGFLHYGTAAARVFSGTIVLTRQSGNTWIAVGQMKGNTAILNFSAGSKTLSGELTQLRLAGASGGVFDAGAINIQYE